MRLLWLFCKKNITNKLFDVEKIFQFSQSQITIEKFSIWYFTKIIRRLIMGAGFPSKNTTWAEVFCTPEALRIAASFSLCFSFKKEDRRVPFSVLTPRPFPPSRRPIRFEHFGGGRAKCSWNVSLGSVFDVNSVNPISKSSDFFQFVVFESQKLLLSCGVEILKDN